MGFLKDAWTKAKDYGSKIYTTVKDVNSKFGDIISQGAGALTKMPHVVPRTIGNVIIGAQKLLGKTNNFDDLINKGKEYVLDKTKDVLPGKMVYAPGAVEYVTPGSTGISRYGPGWKG